MPAAPRSTSPDRSASRSLVAAVLILVEAAVLTGFAVFYLVAVATGNESSSVVATLVSAALILATAAGLVLVARGLRAERRWARAPAVTWQIVQVPVGIGLVQSGRWYLGLPVVVMALVVVGAILSTRPADR